MSSRKGQKRANQLVRAQVAAERRRRRMIVTSILVAFVVLLAGGVTAAVFATHRNAQEAKQYAIPKGATRDQPGLVVSQGPVTVDLYYDYMCPHCREFESLAGSVLNQFTTNGRITLVYHPLNYLNRFSSGTSYSTRSAAAAGCAADAGKLADYSSAVFGKQPAENSKGLTTKQLAQLGTEAGITDAGFTSCVTSQKYADWVAHVSNQAESKGVQSTPTVFVNGKQIDASASALTNAINSAS